MKQFFRTLSFVVICALLLVTASSGQQVAPWEEKILTDNCSDGHRIVNAEHEADRHIAVQEPMDTISPSLKLAAKLSKQCSTTTKSAYAKDWYLFSYANDLDRRPQPMKPKLYGASDQDTYQPR